MLIPGSLAKVVKMECDTHGPHVTLEVVGFWLHDLWWKVVRGTYDCTRILHRRREYLSNTEISNLDYSLTSQEDVLTLKVTMKDLSVVDMFETKAYLSEPFKNLRLIEWSATLLLDPVL